MAISGSARVASRSTALLWALAAVAGQVQVMDDLAGLPIFSPDLEGPPSRRCWRRLRRRMRWSRPEIIHKPIALLHGSHRGDEMPTHLRRVLETLTDRFAADIFQRLPLASLPAPEVEAALARPEMQAALPGFVVALARWVAEPQVEGHGVR